MTGPDLVARLECGNCLEVVVWAHGVEDFAAAAREFAEHCQRAHPGTIHTPGLRIYRESAA